jgi:spore germination protein KC
LNTLGIFKDDKLIEWADDEESVGINLITSDINEAYFQVDCDDDYFVINTENLKRKISEELDNGIPKIKIMMDFEVIVAESTCSVDILNEDNVENLEKLSETKIEEVIRSAIDLSKDNKTDILGFGRLFYMNHNSYYENVKDKWNDEIFPNLAVDVDINVKINSTGTAKLTLEVDKNE